MTGPLCRGPVFQYYHTMEIKDIKKYFFAHRNGITADVLRRAGSGFTMIFGVDVPALSALAREIGHDRELARQLWDDRAVRESHLLAPWLMDAASMTMEECMALALSVCDSEDALMLAFRVLKRHPQASAMLEELETLSQKATDENAPARLSHNALKRHLE